MLAWIRSKFRGDFKTVPRKAPGRVKFRPSVFAFEDRLVPATINVADEAQLTAALGAAVNNDVINFTAASIDLTTAFSATNGGSYFRVTTNLSFTSSVGGTTLSRNSAAAAFRIFEIASTGAVSFTNISFTGGAPDTGNNGGALLFNGAGTFTMTGGTLSNNAAANGVGGAIFISAGTLSLDGATIGASGNSNTAARGGGIGVDGAGSISFDNNATNIRFNSATTTGGGIDFGTSFAGTPTFTALLNVSNNQTTGNGSFGGGLAMRGTGTVTLNGATIRLNQANGDTTSGGGGIAVSAGTVNINGTTTIGGAAAGNTTTGSGGGVLVNGGTLSVASTATVSNNSAVNGAGIALTSGSATISGSVLTNTATGDGGGVFANGGTLTLDGATIGSTGNGNTADHGGGLALAGSANITISGTPSIRFNSATTSGGGIDATLGNLVNRTLSGSLTVSNNQTTANGSFGGGIAMRSNITAVLNISINVAANQANGGTNSNGGGIGIASGTVRLNAGFTVGSATVGQGNTTTGNGGGIAISNGQGAVNLLGTIQGNTATGVGGGVWANSGVVNDFGAVYTGNQAADGGGVALVTGGSGSFSNPTITANAATGSGGGVYLTTGGVVTFSNTTIGGATALLGNSAAIGGGLAIAGTTSFSANITVRNNTATTRGGGIDIAAANTRNHTFSGSTIRQNTVTGVGGLGGGFSMLGSGTITLAGVTIAGNQATGSGSRGGGVYVAGGTVNLSTTAVVGGTVAADANTSAGNGGGVSISGGTFAQSGTAQIVGNSATGAGGGLHATGGTVNLTSAQVGTAAGPNSAAQGGGMAFFGVVVVNVGTLAVESNTATTAGGGVYIDSTVTQNIDFAELVLESNTVTGASGQGGGIAKFNAAGSITLSGIIIRANTATGTNGSGGGLYTSAGTVDITNVTFGGAGSTDGNTAAAGGGGAITVAGGTVNITDGTIQGNSTTGSGGGILVTGGTVAVDPTVITGNVAAGDGGGVNVAGGTFTLTGGDEVTNNTSTGGNGGGINFAGGTGHTITGATIAGNTATAGNGGGINLAAALGAGTVDIATTTIGASGAFLRNTAGANGGGINVAGGVLTVTGGTLGGSNITNGNRAAANGGGISVAGGTVTLSTTISGNSTTPATGLDGGGAYINGGTVTFDGATIGGATTAAGNQARNGGGIEVNAGTVNFANAASTVRFNRAAGTGAGLDLSAAFTGTINATTLLSVLDNQINGVNGRGAGVAVLGAATFTMTGGTIARNSFTAPGGAGGGIHQAAGTVSLTGVTVGGAVLADGNTAETGGGINTVGGTLTLGAGTDVRFNSALVGQGGGIVFSGTTLTLTSVTVRNNRAITAGGGIVITAGTNTITNSTIASNSVSGLGSTGGGIHVTGGTTTADPTIIENNTSAGDGAGLNIAGGVFNLNAGDEVRFNTSTGGNGGGIAISNGTLNVTSALIFGNRANNTDVVLNRGNGGGIFVGGGTANLAGATIGQTGATNDNQALNGAGIALAGGSLNFINTLTTIAFNNAISNGGGIDIAPGYAGTLTVNALVAVTSNTVTGVAGQGGGIANRGVGTVNLNATTTSANQASGAGGLGGGVFSSGGTLNVIGATIGGAAAINGNTAASQGGGLYISGGTFAFSANAIIANNTATAGSGGGLFVGGAAISTIANTTFTTNHASGATGSGGGIQVSGSFMNTLTITAITLNGNTAGAAGGGINLNAGIGGTVAIGGAVNNLIQNNTAATTGGGINVITGALTVTVATFQANSATGNGGGVNLTAGSADVSRTTFVGNSTTANGGAIANLAGTLTLNNDTLSGNTAAAGGNPAIAAGGIAILGVSTNTITSVTIANNTAIGLRLALGTLTIQNSLLGNNAGTDIVYVAGTLTDNGYNLFESFTGFVPNGTGDVLNQDPVLAALGNYGGPNQTIALLPGSPAIDPVGNPTVGPDQRGVGVVNGLKDIGAFESSGFTFGVITGAVQSTNINSNFPTGLSVTVVANNAAEPVNGGIVTFTKTTSAEGATITGATAVNVTIAAGAANRGIVTANGFFGTYNVQLSGKGLPTNATAYTLTNLGVNSITFTNPPVNTPSGQVIGGPVTGVRVQLRDQFGAPLLLAGVNVSITVTSGPGALVPAAIVSAMTNASGVAIFNAAPSPLVINVTGTYQLTATTPRNSQIGAVNATLTSGNFNITASKLIVSPVTTPVRSGQGFNVTVMAVGVDNSVDPNFTGVVTLGINSFVATAAGIAPTLSGANNIAAVAGQVTFVNMSLNRGGTYTLNATSGALTPGISNAIKVNASAIAITSATSVTIPNGVRSANQAALSQPGADLNKDILNVTVVGLDSTGAAADVASNVALSIASAKQLRNGVITDILGTQTFGGTTNQFIAGAAATFPTTLDRWGDYIVRANAAFAPPAALSGNVTVIGRTISVANPPLLVVGPFNVITQVRDVTGDIAQNYTGPSNPTILTISEITQRQNPGITGANGTQSMVVGNNVVATANPFRGVTTFSFVATRPVIVSFGVIDQQQLFIGSSADSGIVITTLDQGRRRPRPLPPVLNLRLISR